MIFAKERERVRSATRAIRDLVVRPARDLALSAELGGGLQALAQLAIAPLRHAPDVAARVPAMAFAAQALAASVRNDRTMRERYLNLLAASMDGARADRVHPGFLEVLRQLTPDEVRIISLFQHDGPYPIISVQSRYRHGSVVSTVLRHFNLLGEQAGCEHPRRAPLYVDNLVRLGIAELRRVRISEDTRVFVAVEQHPEVLAAVAQIEAHPPELARATDTVVADIHRQALYVTAFGRQFYEACEYRPEPT